MIPELKLRGHWVFPKQHTAIWQRATKKISGEAIWLTPLQGTFSICSSALNKSLGSQGEQENYSQVRAAWMRGVHCSQGCSSVAVRYCQKWGSASSSQSPPEEQLLGDTSPLLGELNIFQYGKERITNKKLRARIMKQKVINKWSQNSSKFYAWWMPVYIEIPSLCMLTDQKTSW